MPSQIRGGGYGHHIQRIGADTFIISWRFDTKIRGSRLRWPRSMQRVTDTNGATRFAKKWNCRMPWLA